MTSNNEAPRRPVDGVNGNRILTEISQIENPTREFFNKFKKVELQKHCRQIGLTDVWHRKQEIVEMLLRTYRTQESTQEEVGDTEPSQDIINKILNELEEVKGKLATKDSEIQELNLMMKTYNVTINRLNDRISTLEERLQQQSTSDISSPPPDNELTLLIGDNNVSEVRLSDLGDNCIVKTIKDTTMDLAGCWVREKLDLLPSKCVIYCGSNDLMETENLNNILDDLGSLITELKHKNEKVDIYVCELAPHLKSDIDSKVNMYNEKLKDWCSVNGVNFIKMNQSFRLGTGDIDELCYDYEDNVSPVYFNRYGALRLLNVINKQCKYMKLNKTMKTEKHERIISDRYTSRQSNRGNLGQYVKRSGSELQHYRRTQRSHHPEPSRFSVRSNDYNHNFPELTRRVPFTRNIYDNVDYAEIESRNRKGCFNCGEHNHRRSNCRYDHQIRCNNCFEYGHKSRMCNQSSY